MRFRRTGLEILVEILIATVNITVRYILKFLTASKRYYITEGIPTDQLNAACGNGRTSGLPRIGCGRLVEWKRNLMAHGDAREEK